MNLPRDMELINQTILAADRISADPERDTSALTSSRLSVDGRRGDVFSARTPLHVQTRSVGTALAPQPDEIVLCRPFFVDCHPGVLRLTRRLAGLNETNGVHQRRRTGSRSICIRVIHPAQEQENTECQISSSGR